MSKIWFASDFHYGHVNICYGVSNWGNKENTTRKFNTVEEMNQTIVDNINKYVGVDDDLYFLGDWSFGGINNIVNFWNRIKCKNIYFVLGNHDQHIEKNKSIDGLPLQSLFKMLPKLCSVTINKQQFILSHYPLEEWENMDNGSIHLHGHTHHNLDNSETNTIYKRMDVGVDWDEFRPFSLDEILETMNKRINKKHNKEIKNDK